METVLELLLMGEKLLISQKAPKFIDEIKINK